MSGQNHPERLRQITSLVPEREADLRPRVAIRIREFVMVAGLNHSAGAINNVSAAS